jgi:hypothetical protein
VDGAGVSPRGGGAAWRADHEEVRPTELLALLHDGWRSCTSSSALQARWNKRVIVLYSL